MLLQLQYKLKMSKPDKRELDFYIKLKNEYEKAAKPYIYQFSFSEQPMHKKFRLLLKKFIDILKQGMKQQYRFEDGNQYSYWNQLQKKYEAMDEMSYIINKVYEVQDKKIRIFFALLLQTNKIFDILQDIVTNLNDLYVDGKRKRQNFEKDIEMVSFLKNGQIQIVSTYVQQFKEYVVAKRQAEFAIKKQITELLASLVETVHDRLAQQQKQKIQKAKRLKQEKQQQQERQRQQLQNKKKKFAIQQPPVQQPKPIVVKPNQNISINKIIKVQQTPFQPTPLDIRIKPKHLKNSQHLFNESFKDQMEVFFYDTRPPPNQNKKECFQCKQPLGQGFFIFGSNINYCNYIGEWFCNDHTAEERVQIPYKAKEDFDLKGYSVSKTGYERVKRYYEKAIIEIGYNDLVVKKNKRLYEFLILKRQIHLMYDSICNSQLMDKMLKGRLNYCLRENLFSLKNLYDIYNGHQGPHLDGEFSILSKHFYRCQICQQRKGRICSICNHPPKIFAFELRQAYSCERCQKISHRRCLLRNKCPCE